MEILPPSGLAASPLSATQIELSWEALIGVSGYNLKRATSSGGPYDAVVIGTTSTNRTDSGLLAGTNYYYVVSSVLGGVESEDSAEVSGVPSAPLNEGDVAIGTIDIGEDGSGGATFALSVPDSELGHNYQVLTSGSLTDPDWQPATDVILGNGEVLHIIVPIHAAQTNLFYRLEVWRQ
jgi:hypothetical protein